MGRLAVLVVFVRRFIKLSLSAWNGPCCPWVPHPPSFFSACGVLGAVPGGQLGCPGVYFVEKVCVCCETLCGYATVAGFPCVGENQVSSTQLWAYCGSMVHLPKPKATHYGWPWVLFGVGLVLWPGKCV